MVREPYVAMQLRHRKRCGSYNAYAMSNTVLRASITNHTRFDRGYILILVLTAWPICSSAIAYLAVLLVAGRELGLDRGNAETRSCAMFMFILDCASATMQVSSSSAFFIVPRSQAEILGDNLELASFLQHTYQADSSDHHIRFATIVYRSTLSSFRGALSAF